MHRGQTFTIEFEFPFLVSTISEICCTFVQDKTTVLEKDLDDFVQIVGQTKRLGLILTDAGTKLWIAKIPIKGQLIVTSTSNETLISDVFFVDVDGTIKYGDV